MKALLFAAVLAGCCLEEIDGHAGNTTAGQSGPTGSGAASSTGASGTSGGTVAGTTTGAAGRTTGGFCLDVVPPPPDAGPMIVFAPNPVLDPDSGVWATSLAGATIAFAHFEVLRLGQDGGEINGFLSSPSGSSDAGLTNAQLPSDALVSWASDDGGVVFTEQLIIGDDGTQTCTTVGEPCGEHGACCVGLSCQAAAGGCTCSYAWPYLAPF